MVILETSYPRKYWPDLYTKMKAKITINWLKKSVLEFIFEKISELSFQKIIPKVFDGTKIIFRNVPKNKIEIGLLWLENRIHFELIFPFD